MFFNLTSKFQQEFISQRLSLICSLRWISTFCSVLYFNLNHIIHCNLFKCCCILLNSMIQLVLTLLTIRFQLSNMHQIRSQIIANSCIKWLIKKLCFQRLSFPSSCKYHHLISKMQVIVI